MPPAKEDFGIAINRATLGELAEITKALKDLVEDKTLTIAEAMLLLRQIEVSVVRAQLKLKDLEKRSKSQ